MPTLVYQVMLHVPDGVDMNEVSPSDMEDLITETLNHTHEKGLMPGVSHITTVFEDAV